MISLIVELTFWQSFSVSLDSLDHSASHHSVLGVENAETEVRAPVEELVPDAAAVDSLSLAFDAAVVVVRIECAALPGRLGPEPASRAAAAEL